MSRGADAGILHEKNAQRIVIWQIIMKIPPVTPGSFIFPNILIDWRYTLESRGQVWCLESHNFKAERIHEMILAARNSDASGARQVMSASHYASQGRWQLGKHKPGQRKAAARTPDPTLQEGRRLRVARSSHLSGHPLLQITSINVSKYLTLTIFGVRKTTHVHMCAWSHGTK